MLGASKKAREWRNMADKQKMLYVVTSGPDRAEQLYAPFVLAQTAVAMGMEATVYFVIKGVMAVKKGEADKIKMGSFPRLSEVMQGAIKAGVKVMVCEQSCGLLGIPKGSFEEWAKIVGAATLNDLTLDADGVLCF